MRSIHARSHRREGGQEGPSSEREGDAEVKHHRRNLDDPGRAKRAHEPAAGVTLYLRKTGNSDSEFGFTSCPGSHGRRRARARAQTEASITTQAVRRRWLRPRSARRSSHVQDGGAVRLQIDRDVPADPARESKQPAHF